MVFDILIKNGCVVDGAGNPWFKSDIAVEDEKIVELKRSITEGADVVIDATGLIVSPGFIDLHSHSDWVLLVNPKAESKIRQGVTLEVFPNCGSGAAPLQGFTVDVAERRAKAYDITVDWTTVDEYLSRLEKGIAVNVAPLVGFGTIRTCIMGYENREPTKDELEEEKALLAQSLKDGARGLCAGLRYVPQSYASTDEVIELCKVVAQHSGFFTMHIRDEGDRGNFLGAIKEIIEIGKKASLPVNISHFHPFGKLSWGKSKEAIELIDAARSHGLDITADAHQYLATGTGPSAWIPRWAHEGGDEKIVERLKDTEMRKQLKKETAVVVDIRGGAENMMISLFLPDTSYEGRTIAEVSNIRGTDPVDTVLDLLSESIQWKEGGSCRVINFNMVDDDIVRIVQHPHVSISSDGSAVAPYGILGKGNPHPRYFGTYPQVFRKYVRGETRKEMAKDRGAKLLTMEEAVRKMTSLPANRLSLYNRGLIRPGMWADIVVFDPDKISDKATYRKPHQYPVGIPYVLVNGVLVIDNGEHTGALPGKVLRRLK